MILTSLLLFFATSISVHGNHSFSTRIRGVCVNRDPPVIARRGDSCGVPDFVDVEQFGNNQDTVGIMWATPYHGGGMNLRIRLKYLPRPDLVLTAWLVWVPGGVTSPPIFEVANHASPCAATDSGFTTGFGRDANEFRYVERRGAVLDVDLNFNPTLPGEGPLTRETFCYQRDVPGIQSTVFKHHPTPDGTFIPTSSSYMRRYDPSTGFELLDRNGDPEYVKSPVAAMGVEVIAHVDKTTHGLSQGVGGVDHYFVMFFPFENPIQAHHYY